MSSSQLGIPGIKLGSPRSSFGSQNARCIVVNYNSLTDVRITVSYKVYSICIILHSITELKNFYIKSVTFKFLVAKLGYQVQIPGSLSTFQVACGYRATTKSYTVISVKLKKNPSNTVPKINSYLSLPVSIN